jgi:hypothetical protein
LRLAVSIAIAVSIVAATLQSGVAWPFAQIYEGKSLSVGSGDARSNPRGCRLSWGPYSFAWQHSRCRQGDFHSTNTSSRTTYSSLLFVQTLALGIAVELGQEQTEGLAV